MRRFLKLQDDDGSLMLAIMLTILIAGFSGLLLTMTVGQAGAVRHDQRYTEVFPAADAGISRGLFMLNNGLASSMLSNCPSAAATSSMCQISLSGQTATWYAASSAASTTSPPYYTLTAKTTTTGTATRTVNAVAYQSARFGFGLFADQSVVFEGGNHVYSYNSTTGTTSTTNHGSVGSNGSVNINGNSNADSVTLYNWNANPSNARCNGGPCSTGYTTIGTSKDFTSAPATQFMQDGLAACGGTPAAWQTSNTVSHALPAGTWCASSLNLDADTTVTGPTVIYVSGNVTLGAHLNINYAAGVTPLPANLQIYSLGSSVDMSNHTNVAAAVYAPLAYCSGGAQDVIYGSLMCGRIRNVGGWTLYYDDALGAIGAGDFRIKNYREN